VQLPYDPAAVLLLEIATSIVARSQEDLKELWQVQMQSRADLSS
jgi:brefeldin A-resistance guanine nucleotide exchange factor 1